MSSAADPVESTAAQGEAISRSKVAKRVYMLHDPKDYSCLGKYVSTAPRLAALKAASRKHTQILLRETNTKILHHYEGGIRPLDTPQRVTRGDPPVTVEYTKKPFVRRVCKPYLMPELDTACDAEEVPSNPTA